MPLFQAAFAHNLAVVAPRWVFESFRAHTLLDTGSFRLRPLEGLVVCTTGLAASARARAERLAQQMGAVYDPTLEIGYTSVLIAQRVGGAKFDACVAHSVPVVHESWLLACSESGSLLDEADFALDRVLVPSRLFTHFQSELHDVVQRLPELVQRFRRRQSDRDADDSDDGWIELLDSCVLHLVGFPPSTEATLQRLVRTSMGTLYYELNPAHVTHVVVSPSLRDDRVLTQLEALVARESADAHVHFVSPKWLLDSVKGLGVAPEALYPVELDAEHDAGVVDAAVPASASAVGDTSMVDVSFEQDAHDDNVDDNDDKADDKADDNADDNGDEDSADSSGLFRGCAFLLLCRNPDDRVVIKPMLKQIQAKSSAQAVAMDARDLACLDFAQFAFVTHLVVCAGVEVDADAASHVVAQLSGLPSIGADEASDSRQQQQQQRQRQRRVTFVSDLWVSCCLSAGVKLSHDAHELFALTRHQPRSLFPTPLPLTCFAGVRASTSVYVGVDRLVVLELLRLAGAHATSKLSKRNTHLICLKPIGMKFDKATQWGLAVVTARWLVQSILHGALLDPRADEFQVKDTNDSGDRDDNDDVVE